MNSALTVVGSLNADFVIRVARFPVPGETLVGEQFSVFPGGKGANQAFAAANLGSVVKMVGQVGADAHAAWLKENLAAVGVDVTYVTADLSTSSGIATITINADGQNEIIIVPGANGTFGVDKLERSRPAFAGAGLVLLQLEIPLSTVAAAARLAREAGAVVLLDPAPAQELTDELLQLADYLTPNETELAILAGQSPRNLDPPAAAKLAGSLLDRGAKTVIVKMGAQGALLTARDREHFWPAIPVKAVDTTAAGDAFNAAFASALARGESELAAGRYATAAAACSVTRPGAQPSLPSHAEVLTLLRQ